MKVVILCGGLAIRLREETETRPKPMVEIGGQPIVWHVMRDAFFPDVHPGLMTEMTEFPIERIRAFCDGHGTARP